MRWDLFCRVIDNFGDIGACWRLASDLARRGDTVRLWTDDASALAWMAPQVAAGVEVHDWADATLAEPADVVVEAFGCDPPETFVARMAARTAASVCPPSRPAANGRDCHSAGLAASRVVTPGGSRLRGMQRK
jgi:uncharacterized repeat protein (TIGR03837 family)